MAMYFLGQNQQAPTVNYPQGDYRTISRLDRSRAEAAKNAQLEAELARKRAWEDELFQRRLAELQKNIWGGGGIGGSVSPAAAPQFAPQAGGQQNIPQAPAGSGPGGMETSMDRMNRMNPLLQQIMRSAQAKRLWDQVNLFTPMGYLSGAPMGDFIKPQWGLDPYGRSMR